MVPEETEVPPEVHLIATRSIKSVSTSPIIVLSEKLPMDVIDQDLACKRYYAFFPRHSVLHLSTIDWLIQKLYSPSDVETSHLFSHQRTSPGL